MNSGNETSPAANGSVLAGLSIRTSRCRELARTQEIKTHYHPIFRVSYGRVDVKGAPWIFENAKEQAMVGKICTNIIIIQ